MIWVGGRVVADESLRISVADRTFEHGLGLFESFRTWDGTPSLLARHLDRMTRSAEALGLPLETGALPDADAVAALVRAEAIIDDARLRITLTGGTSPSGGSLLWMRASPIAPGEPSRGAVVASSFSVDEDDPIVRHKTLNYWRRRLAFEGARARGEDDVLSQTADGRFWEGSRSNLFAVVGLIVTTPRADGPLLPGIMRGVVLERARELGLDATEGEFAPGFVRFVGEAFLTNSVRGIIPIGRLFSRKLPAPGPITRRLAEAVSTWLRRGGDPR